MPGGHRVISAQRDRNFACFKRLEHQLRVLGAGRSNFFQILGVGIAFFFLLRNGYGNVAAVFDFVPERFEARFESGDAHRGRPHIDAAA